MSHIAHNLKAISNELGKALTDQLNQVLESGIESLEGPIQEISINMAVAAKHNKQELMEACKDQLALALIEQKAVFKAGTESTLDFIVSNGITMLVNGAIAGLSGMIVVP